MNNSDVFVLSVEMNSLGSWVWTSARALGYKDPRGAVNKKVRKQNKDVCSIYTPIVAGGCVAKMATQGQEEGTETCVCKIGTQGQEEGTDEFVAKIGTYSQEEGTDEFVAKMATQGPIGDMEKLF